MALFVFAVATAALRMQAFALGAIERPPLPRMAASMLEQGPERPTAAVVPPPRRLTDLLELEQTKGVPQKQGETEGLSDFDSMLAQSGTNVCHRPQLSRIIVRLGVSEPVSVHRT